MSQRTERAVLNHLIETCRDVEWGLTIGTGSRVRVARRPVTEMGAN
jgi:hypothetical protein